MKIRDFAAIQHVSYEAIRKKIKRHERELQGHITLQGRTQYLDEYAVRFLQEHMKEKQIVTYAADTTEQLQQLQDENKRLLVKIAQLQEELLQEKDNVKLLQQEKIELLEERKENQPEEKQGFLKRIFKM